MTVRSQENVPEELYLLGEPARLFNSRKNRNIGIGAGVFMIVMGALLMGILLIPDLAGNDICIVQIFVLVAGVGVVGVGVWMIQFMSRLRAWVAVSEAGIIYVKNAQVQGFYWHEVAGFSVERGTKRAWLMKLASLGPAGDLPAIIVTTLVLRGKKGDVLAIDDDAFGDGIGDIKGLAEYIVEHIPPEEKRRDANNPDAAGSR